MEVVKFKSEREFFNAIDGENGEYTEYKDEKLSNFDSEKGFVDVRAYIKRNSDGKKFTAEYTRGGQGDKWADDWEFIEDVQKPKKPTYSEAEVFKLLNNFNNDSASKFFNETAMQEWWDKKKKQPKSV